MDVLLDAVLGLFGLAIVVIVVDSAVRTFVVPRGVVALFTRLIFLVIRWAFDVIARPSRSYETRDRVMALYAPIALLALPAVWLGSLFVGFALLFMAIADWGWQQAFRMSGSSLLTLGFDRPDHGWPTALSFVEAATGLALLALLIAYLPTIYGSFSHREILVTRLSVRAGTPPSPVDLLVRAHRTGFLIDLDEFWTSWELWFVELEETHTTFASLAFFRSPDPHRSWITASGVVLDAGALRLAVLDIPWTPQAAICIRSGFLALRAIADLYDVDHDPDPAPADPIGITREEFDDVCRQLAEAGVPLKADLDQAWLDFAGWRVNYDRVLIVLASMLMAPYAPWVSDRNATTHRPRLRHRQRPR